MTKKEIMSLLDEKGIEYKKTSTKSKLELLLAEKNPDRAGIQEEARSPGRPPSEATVQGIIDRLNDVTIEGNRYVEEKRRGGRGSATIARAMKEVGRVSRRLNKLAIEERRLDAGDNAR